MIRKFRLFSRLRADERGVGAIETAILVPVLSFMALGFVDLTLGFTEKLKVQQYAQTGGELIVANVADLPEDSEIKSELAAASGLPQSAITITRWTECNASKVSFKAKCSTVSAIAADFIKIDVTDTYQPILGDIGPYGYLGDTQLTGNVTIRVPEDY